MARILAIRFSAIGDVAMTIPVIHSLATQYPQHEIIVLSGLHLESLFGVLPSNVSFFSVDFKGKNKGIAGIYRLFRELKEKKIDYVADLHSVLRAKVLRMLFSGFTKAGIAAIHKGRWGKWKLTRRYNKVLTKQKSSFRRYADVFECLGFPVKLDFVSVFGEGKGDFAQLRPLIQEKETGAKWIGIAPFAKHKGKIYPVHLQERVVAHFSGRRDVRVFLFGGGKKEKEVFRQWEEKYPGVMSVAGLLNMNKELILMSYLDVMLSMDSANMHMAALVNTPVVSVWGATHPYAGFVDWNQSPDNIVQLDMPCRPCSVYGKKKCYRKDYACLNDISPDQVIQRIEAVIS